MGDSAPLRIAVIGAGPAGFFAIQALLAKEGVDLQVDLIEKLPTPWGLVRSGVAPDHPKIKTVSKVFEKITDDPRVRFIGNITIGLDISVTDLLAAYDGVVFATGAEIGRTLGIPGEDLPGVMSAAQFVTWYNAHPDYANFAVDLSGTNALVIGAGNVAMDVGRLLALAPDELAKTDIADHALGEIRTSKITHVKIIARRGPEHAAFTSPELRDLLELEHTNVLVGSEAVAAAEERISKWNELPKDVRQNMEAFKKLVEVTKTFHPRNLEILFLLAPLAFEGDGKVERVRFSVNIIEGDKVHATDEEITLPADLVVTAVGYDSLGIAGVPLERGKVKNLEGRVVDESGAQIPGMYVVGWAKRGPSGVIGTNKHDAAEVMDRMLADLVAVPTSRARHGILLPLHSVDLAGWKKINEREIAKGLADERPRVKFPTYETLLANTR